MARIKMFADRLAKGSAWLAAVAATLVAAYEGSAIAAHLGTLVEWR